MSPATSVEARVSHRYGFAPEKVFDAWLQPSLLGRWMFGPAVRDEEVLRLELEPKVGGMFSFLVRRGEDEIDHVGEYLEIDRPRRLVFRWHIGQVSTETSTVTIDIRPTEEGCELTLVHALDPSWAEFVDRSREAWRKMLAALQVALAEGGLETGRPLH